MKKPVKIFHLLYKLTTGGAERVVADIVNHRTKDIEHVICSFARPDDFALRICSDVPVLTLDKEDGLDFSLPYRLAKYCKEYQIDLIHAVGWSTYVDGYFASLLCGINRPGFIYAFHGKIIEDLHGIPARRIWAQRLLAYGCDAIVAPSKEMVQDYSSTYKVSDKRISLIYNGVDIGKFAPPNQEQRITAKAAFGFDADDLVLGCIARLDPVKNLPGLLRSFARLREKHHPARLLIVGDGTEYQNLQQQIVELQLNEYVLLAGQRSDVDMCYHALDLYVQPSFYEGLSVTILEAMASGLPIVAGDVGGTSEMVTHEENGILFQVNDEVDENLFVSLELMSKDPQRRARAGLTSRQIVENRFSQEMMINQYERLFKRLAG